MMTETLLRQRRLEIARDLLDQASVLDEAFRELIASGDQQRLVERLKNGSVKLAEEINLMSPNKPPHERAHPDILAPDLSTPLRQKLRAFQEALRVL